MAKSDTIKFDYDAIQVSYTKIMNIQEKSNEACTRLEKACDEAEKKMKGQYRDGFEDKKKDVLKDFKKSIKDLKDITKMINGASKDMTEIDMKISDSIQKSL